MTGISSSLLTCEFCISDCSYTPYQVSALSRIAHGSQSVDSTAVAASQTVSVKGSSLQVTVIRLLKIYSPFFMRS